MVAPGAEPLEATAAEVVDREVEHRVDEQPERAVAERPAVAGPVGAGGQVEAWVERHQHEVPLAVAAELQLRALRRRAEIDERRLRREAAERKFWEKVREKRNHREMPYTNESSGSSYSQIASQFKFSNPTDSVKTNEPKATESKTDVIAFPIEESQKQSPKPKPGGILNSEQFNSLEI